MTLKQNVFTIENKMEISKTPEKPQEQEPPDGPATFEQALSATGFGKFNLLLMTLIAIPSAWATMMSTTTMSYVFPVAQCDLNLTLQDKGLLNAITYLGMVSSGFLWGFLSDTLGRKKLLVYGYLLDAFFVLLAGCSQNYSLVLFSKYMNGCIINGPFAVLTTTISEFHSAKYRARILMLMGLLYASTNIVLPILGWFIMPLPININYGSFTLHSWNIFLLISSLPSLTAGIVHMFLPESPKFLMTVGRNEEALRVFSKIHRWNNGNKCKAYPIKNLIDEATLREEGGYKHGGVVTANRTKIQALKEGWQQITPLFYPPHGVRLLLVCIIQFGIMLGLNTIRLWLPQIFTAINDYEKDHKEGGHLCTMLEYVQPKTESLECTVNTQNEEVYKNAIIVALTGMSAYVLASLIINILGKKKLYFIFGMASGIACFCLYVATNSALAIGISSGFTALLGVCTNMTLAVTVDLFPTSLRTMTISIVMMTGRLGAMLGNVIFPFLIELGCLPPFATIGSIVVLAIILTTLLPNTDLKPLE